MEEYNPTAVFGTIALNEYDLVLSQLEEMGIPTFTKKETLPGNHFLATTGDAGSYLTICVPEVNVDQAFQIINELGFDNDPQDTHELSPEEKKSMKFIAVIMVGLLVSIFGFFLIGSIVGALK